MGQPPDDKDSPAQAISSAQGWKSLDVVLFCSFCGSRDFCILWKILLVGQRPTLRGKDSQVGPRGEVGVGCAHLKTLFKNKAFKKISLF